ncbi:hypothetical protein Tco_0056366, partial [Tanacetum coccineum]
LLLVFKGYKAVNSNISATFSIELRAVFECLGEATYQLLLVFKGYKAVNNILKSGLWASRGVKGPRDHEGPCKSTTGETYEKEFIEDKLRTHSICPTPGRVLFENPKFIPRGKGEMEKVLFV